MHHAEGSYVPAAGHDWLLFLYDPIQRMLGGDALKRPLVAQAALGPGDRVLDVGCGTGSLSLLVKREAPEAVVVGIDPDPKALALAEHKAARAGLEVCFDRGFADRMPYEDGAFDRVFSSFMFHHLDRDAKGAMLREIRRVLAPGGSLHLLDFGPARRGIARRLGVLIHHAGALRDNLEGRTPSLMSDAGLLAPEEVDLRGSLLGPLAYYRAGR